MYIYECLVKVDFIGGGERSGYATVTAKNGISAARKAKAATKKRLKFEGMEWSILKVSIMRTSVIGRQLELFG
jgi:hypothetical protein